MPLRKSGSVFLLLIAMTGAASVSGISIFKSRETSSLATRERRVWAAAVHSAEFTPVAHSTARPSCETSEPPEPLMTPDPLLDQPEDGAKAKVSFIVGVDGRVYSPLVLESAGLREDQTILNTVKSWRYRPAMCNGTPTEVEARVEFSSH